MKWSDIVYYQGKKVNRGTLAILTAMNKVLQNSPYYGKEREDMTLMQGSYNAGGVSASAGTHDGGAAFDVSPFNIRNRVVVGRLFGTSLNERPPIKRLWSRHGHGIVIGDGTASRGAKVQQSEYLAGGDGLAGNRPDPDWRPMVLPILFVAPWDERGKIGTRYVIKSSYAYAQPHTKSAKRKEVHAGAKFGVVAVVNVRGVLWAADNHGDFVPVSNLQNKLQKAVTLLSRRK